MPVSSYYIWRFVVLYIGYRSLYEIDRCKLIHGKCFASTVYMEKSYTNNVPQRGCEKMRRDS